MDWAKSALEQGWTVLSALITADEDPNVRAEAANALASYGVERAWPCCVRPLSGCRLAGALQHSVRLGGTTRH